MRIARSVSFITAISPTNLELYYHNEYYGNEDDFLIALADAMRAPRVHHQALPDSLTYEEGGIAPAVLDSLRAMGHRMRRLRGLTNVNAIMRVPGGWHGVPEPRRSGGAVGY